MSDKFKNWKWVAWHYPTLQSWIVNIGTEAEGSGLFPCARICGWPDGVWWYSADDKDGRSTSGYVESKTAALDAAEQHMGISPRRPDGTEPGV